MAIVYLQVMEIKIHFAVVKETQPDFFDVPVHGTSPGIEGNDGVEVGGGDARHARLKADVILIGGAAHP